MLPANVGAELIEADFLGLVDLLFRFLFIFTKKKLKEAQLEGFGTPQSPGAHHITDANLQ